jgi:hypothetical protein
LLFAEVITIGFSTFVIGFLVSGLVFFAAVWLYFDYRDRVLYDRQRRRHVHHCVKCGNLYTTRDGGAPAECPVCGFKNPSLRF